MKQAFVKLFLLGNILAVTAAMLVLASTARLAPAYKPKVMFVVMILGIGYWLYSSLSTVTCAMRSSRSMVGYAVGVLMISHIVGISSFAWEQAPAFLKYVGF